MRKAGAITGARIKLVTTTGNMRTIEFDVATVAEKASREDAKGELRIVVAGLEGNLSAEENNSQTSRVKFGVYVKDRHDNDGVSIYRPAIRESAR